MKIMILETDGINANVLCEDGAFRTVPAQPGWECGMELFIDSIKEKEEESDFEKPEKAKIFTLPRIMKFAAGIAACLVAVFGIHSIYTNMNTVNSYVEIGINPAVRLAVNKGGKVVSISGINTDGEALVAKLTEQDKIDGCVSDIINQTVADGYFAEGSRPVSIVIADNDAIDAEKTEKQALEAAAKALEANSIQPNIQTRKTTLTEADAVHESVKKSVEMGMPLTAAYELSDWGSTSETVWLEEIDYKREGIFTIDFSRDFAPSGDEKIELVSKNGERIPATLLAFSDDSWKLSADSLKEGEIYRLEISATHAGQNIALSGVFLASKYIQSDSDRETVTAENTSVFPGGVLIEDDDLGRYSLTDKTTAVIKTQNGESFTADKIEIGHESVIIYTDKIALGDLFTAEISGLVDRRGRPCSLRAVCRAASEKNPDSPIDEVEFDLEDGEIHIKFTKRMNWGAKPALTVTGKDGKTLEVRSLKYAATEIKAHIGGMKQGGEYLFTITDPSGKVASLSGSFLVHEMPDSDDADDDD